MRTVVAAIVAVLLLAAPAHAQRAIAGVDGRLPPPTATRLFEGGERELAANGGRKYARTFFVQYENAFGGTLWRYNSHWRWYAKRRKIVHAKHWEWASALAPLWSYHGTKYLHKHGAVGTSMVGRRVQGHFVFSIPGLGAVRHKYPWIDVKVYASGNHWMLWDDG